MKLSDYPVMSIVYILEYYLKFIIYMSSPVSSSLLFTDSLLQILCSNSHDEKNYDKKLIL